MIANFLFYAAAFIVALGVLVVVHEYGHYLAARLCGVKVLRFSFGFGKVLCSRRLGRDRTEWALSLFPLGGYVKMLDEREGAVERHELDRAFNQQSLLKRACIVAAGPIANFLLAIALYWGLFIHGNTEYRPLLAAPLEATAAAGAGLLEGSLVRSVNGQAVASWEDLRWEAMQGIVNHETLHLEIAKPNGVVEPMALSTAGLSSESLDRDPLADLGLSPYRPCAQVSVMQLVAGAPAQAAGLQVGDVVEKLDGRPLCHSGEIGRLVNQQGAQAIRLEVRRGDAVLAYALTPRGVEEQGRQVYRIGTVLQDDPQARAQLLVAVSYPPLESLRRAVRQTWDTSALTVRMLWRMLSGQISIKNLSGPVTIADYAGQSARLGLVYYLKFLALISISLGVLNLLPVPVLDGGHLLYYSLEAVKGRPLSEKFLDISQRIGFAVLILLMASALFNDFNRLFFS